MAHEAGSRGGSGELWQELLGVMDRLYSPHGCPWCGEQTHRSLVKYLLEESHELADAIEAGDRLEMREELGDVLLQVVFHARIASGAARGAFTADDVVRDLIDKMVRRHPHVFAPEEPVGDGAPAGGTDSPTAPTATVDLVRQWDAIKREEKQRESVLDGIPSTLGALARAQKILGRARRAGLLAASAESAELAMADPDGAAAPQVQAEAENHSGAEQGGLTEEQVGAQLLALVSAAASSGIDAEGALRAATRELITDIRGREARES